MSTKHLLRMLWTYRATITFIVAPIILLPLPLVLQTPESKCAYAMLLMAVFWVTEVVHLAVTSLLPVIILPMIGLLGSKEVCVNYIKDISVMLIGGLMVAIAVEHSNLHKRIAMRILMLMGTQTRWLMLGFMLPTFVLSMWISNTATTSMMIPIAMAVVNTLYNRGDDVTKKEKDNVANLDQYGGRGNDAFTNTDDKSTKSEENGHMNGMNPSLTIVVRLYEQRDLSAPVTFTSWIVFGLPLGCVCVLVCWVWLQIYFLGIRNFTKCKSTDQDTSARIKSVIKKEYDSLGPMRFNEMAVLGHFIVLVLLWFFRKPGFMTGWSSLFPPGFATDATAAITVSLSLFVFPSRIPEILRREKRKSGVRPVPALLDWSTVSHRMPWGVIILVGGGFALADASQISGLTAAIGESLVVFANLPKWVINLTVITLVAGMTEFTSNTPTTILVIPIIANMADKIGVNTLYLTLSAALSASFAFMLPVATGPNAVVFSYGHLKVADMLKCGFLMNVLCIGLLTAAANTYGVVYFNWEEVAWISSNVTATVAPSIGH